MTLPVTAKLDRIAARYAANPGIPTMTVTIEHPPTGFAWNYGDPHRAYFIASITKLFTVAMIMQLRNEGTLTLDTRAADLLGADTMAGLNVYDGHDFGSAITVRELLMQTSGIPDYYEQKRPDGTTIAGEMLHTDTARSFEELLETARAMPSPFAPSTPGKALYCDTNYQLLGRILEVATCTSYEHAIARRILEPLRLDGTWLFTPDTLARYDEPAAFLHGVRRLRIPKTIASFPPDGAVVSTAADQVRFLRGFVCGELFPAHYLTEMTAQWNSVFSRLVPIDYGVGVMRFKVPSWQSPFAKVPEMLGHSGAFGSVLYFIPQRDLYLAGTVNQMRPPSLPHRMLPRLLAQF